MRKGTTGLTRTEIKANLRGAAAVEEGLECGDIVKKDEGGRTFYHMPRRVLTRRRVQSSGVHLSNRGNVSQQDNEAVKAALTASTTAMFGLEMFGVADASERGTNKKTGLSPKAITKLSDGHELLTKLIEQVKKIEGQQ